MSRLDDKVAGALDNQADRQLRSSAAADAVDEDELIAQLENDDAVLDGLREKRMQQLHEEVSRAKSMRALGHGTYETITDEKKLMDLTTSTKRCVVHFFQPAFRRCSIMDVHLETLANRHLDARFLRINVEAAPFLVEKLKIQVLPCVISFIDGQVVHRILGFEGLTYDDADDFDTWQLEARLIKSGVLQRAMITDVLEDTRRKKMGEPIAAARRASESDDDDWD